MEAKAAATVEELKTQVHAEIANHIHFDINRSVTNLDQQVRFLMRQSSRQMTAADETETGSIFALFRAPPTPAGLPTAPPWMVILLARAHLAVESLAHPHLPADSLAANKSLCHYCARTLHV